MIRRAPVTRSGGATSWNSYTPSAAQSAASAVRSQYSPSIMPMSRRHSMCIGRIAPSTPETGFSTIRLSAATAATSWSCSHDAHVQSRPAPGSAPSPVSRNLAHQPVRTSTMSPRLHGDALRPRRLVELGGRDRVAEFAEGRPRRAARTMSSSTPREVMPLTSTLSIPQWNAPRLVTELAGKPVVQLVLVVDVGQRIPLGGGLQRHDDHVVVEPHRACLGVAAQLHGRRILQPLWDRTPAVCWRPRRRPSSRASGSAGSGTPPAVPDEPKSTPSGKTLPCLTRARRLLRPSRR